MVIVATFVTDNFRAWRRSWRGASRPPKVSRPTGSRIGRHNRGVLAAFDYESGAVIFQQVMDTPSGFAFADNRLYVNSMYGNRVYILNEGLEVVSSFSNHLMNDLHSLSASPASLLISSSGADAILELSTDGALMWHWLATEHGYERPAADCRSGVFKGVDFRVSQIDTMTQATHCNSAVRHMMYGRDVVVATLFHQGEIIAIDRDIGKSWCLVDGLSSPHNVRRHSQGWLVSDSRSGTVRVYDDAFNCLSVIISDFRWVQDALMTEPGRLLIGDANNTRLVEWDMYGARPTRSIPYSVDWKLYQIEVVGGQWESLFRATARRRLGRMQTFEQAGPGGSQQVLRRA